MHKQNINIIKIKNKKLLEEKLYQLRHNNVDGSLEEKIVDMFVAELLTQGKDSNQLRQISKISKILAQSMGLDARYCDELGQAAKIYDIGNIMISTEVYMREDTLSFEEFNIVKSHTMLGYEILKFQGFASTNLGAIMSSEHHEWWDGGGYPQQKKGAQIDIASRIVSVADTAGALFRKRPGRAVWQYDKILEFIEKRRGIQFDPDVVDAFLMNQEVIHEILCVDRV
ncbi:MAG: hypothetical protein COA92_00870 [Sulfurovum sp.]|nr:MAG: hypothetical protein COA92_00870 [Sulfurovum sp.]